MRRVGAGRARPLATTLLALAVAATLMVAVVLGALRLGTASGPGPPAESGAARPADDLLPLPDVGAALAVHLEDGSPVFVGQPAEGRFVVVDALDPHFGTDLVAFCTANGWYENLGYGSRFDGWGDWTSGPSPCTDPAGTSRVCCGRARPPVT